MRVAFVGYRDYDDGEITKHDFTTDIGALKSYMQGLTATGGADVCEDVLGGLEAALDLNWASTVRVLYLVTHTPNHGRRFHDGFEVCSTPEAIKQAVLRSGMPEDEREQAEERVRTKCFDLHGDDPRQWEATDKALQRLQELEVQLVCLRVGKTADRMLAIFRQEYNKAQPQRWKMQDFELEADPEVFCKLVMRTSASSISCSFERLSQMKQVDAAAMAASLMPLQVDPTPADWERRSGWVKATCAIYTYMVEEIDELPTSTHKKCTVWIRPAPFAYGAMRFAFYIVQEDLEHCKLVGKVYRFAGEAYQKKDLYEGDMAAQALAQYIAKEFTREYPEEPLQFVQAQLLELDKDAGLPYRYMALEPWIPGVYEKKTSNGGFSSTNSEAAQAFSHFSFVLTEGEYMVTDIQGVANTLTDPQIHSRHKRFGLGNLGEQGMDRFFNGHQCSHICKALRLSKHPSQLDWEADEWTALTGAAMSGEQAAPAEEVEVLVLPNKALQLFLQAAKEAAKVALTRDTSPDQATSSRSSPSQAPAHRMPVHHLPSTQVPAWWFVAQAARTKTDAQGLSRSSQAAAARSRWKERLRPSLSQPSTSSSEAQTAKQQQQQPQRQAAPPKPFGWMSRRQRCSPAAANAARRCRCRAESLCTGGRRPSARAAPSR